MNIQIKIIIHNIIDEIIDDKAIDVIKKTNKLINYSKIQDFT